MRQLKDEFKVPLAEVDRWWIRKPATAVIGLFLIVIIPIMTAIFEYVSSFIGTFKDVAEAWKGNN